MCDDLKGAVPSQSELSVLFETETYIRRLISKIVAVFYNSILSPLEPGSDLPLAITLSWYRLFVRKLRFGSGSAF